MHPPDMPDSPPGTREMRRLLEPTALGAATDELVAWLRREGLLGPDRLVVEIGCGMGGLLCALSPEVEAVVGLETSGAMCAEARDRSRGLDNVIVLQTPGRDLSMIDDGGADLVLLTDPFSDLLSAGSAEGLVREAGRALAPGGALVVIDGLDSGDFASWAKEFEDLARAAGLEPRYVGQQTLSTGAALVFIAAPGDQA
jgi:SAM-dependent methyltransferase